MTPREKIAHEFSRRNRARLENARMFRAELKKLVGTFFRNDVTLRNRIEEIESDELDIPVAAPEEVTDVESFLEVIDGFIGELEDVDAKAVLAQAREYDAEDLADA